MVKISALVCVTVILNYIYLITAILYNFKVLHNILYITKFLHLVKKDPGLNKLVLWKNCLHSRPLTSVSLLFCFLINKSDINYLIRH